MILVLCLNPAVDKSCVLRRFKARGRNVLREVLTLPGGKGINVARVLKSLGDRAMLLGWTAGYTGDFVETETRRAGISARWLRLKGGHTRFCLSVLHGGKAPTEANESGPRIGGADIAGLLKSYRRLLPQARLILLSGSLPEGCPEDLYARLIALARSAGKPVFLDTSAPALGPAAARRPDLVKVNHNEGTLAGLRKRGVKDVIITLGARGAVASLDGRRLRALAPKVRALSPVGCGDTFLAGMAHARLRGWEPERALAFSTALATASAKTLGAGVYRPRDVPGLLRRVRIS